PRFAALLARGGRARRRLVVTIVADRLDRAALERLVAERDVVGGLRLAVHERVAALVVALEEVGRRLPARVAVDALVVDVELPGGVLGELVLLVGHVRGGNRVGPPGGQRDSRRVSSRARDEGRGTQFGGPLPDVAPRGERRGARVARRGGGARRVADAP